MISIALQMRTQGSPVVEDDDLPPLRRLRYCTTCKLKYFGYKLVMLSTFEGIPIAYDLVSANTDERQAVEDVLEVVIGIDVQTFRSIATY